MRFYYSVELSSARMIDRTALNYYINSQKRREKLHIFGLRNDQSLINVLFFKIVQNKKISNVT